MTDKEQIIIDGCNVLKCRYYQYKTLKDCEMRYPESGDCEIGLINYLFNGNLDMEKLCVDNPNYYFKQLARKTQECEELKEKCEELKEDRYNLNMEMYVFERYRKDLEEIEKEVHDEMCDTLGHLCAYCDGKHSCITLKILDIIRRAKGEE